MLYRNHLSRLLTQKAIEKPIVLTKTPRHDVNERHGVRQMIEELR